MSEKTINRTQHWLIALFITLSLFCVGVVITLLNRPAKPAAVANQTAIPAESVAFSAASTANLETTNANSTAKGTLTEQVALQKASQILPTNRIEGIQKINYEGKLAYQITTTDNQLYLNAKTGDVLVITPKITAKPAVIQVGYEPHQGEHERGEHEEHEHGERDDD